MRLAGLVGFVLVACGSSAKPAPPPTPPVAAPEVAATPPEEPAPPPADDEGVVVLEAGAEPRAVLRYDLEDKTRRKVELVMTAGKAAPKKMSWTYDVRRADGGFDLRMKVTKAEAPFKGKSGSWRVSDRGRHAAPTSEKSAQVLVQATQTEHMLPLFPADAVGVGARWTQPSAVSLGIGAATVPGITTWELERLDGTTVTARGTLAVQGDDILIRDVKMSMDLKATIVATVDLTSLAGEATMDMEQRSQVADRPETTYASKSALKMR